jgi:hypothetical protein
MRSTTEHSTAHKFHRASSDLLRFLDVVSNCEPLTFPEVIAELPYALRIRGKSRIVLASRPTVVLWDGIRGRTAMLLSRLLNMQRLSLQPCCPELYRTHSTPLLPILRTSSVTPSCDSWLPCTVGAGPVHSLNVDWVIGFRSGAPSN